MTDQPSNQEQGALRALEHVVATDFEGGEGVLVDLNTKKYYQLNETAMLVWRGVERGRGLAEIVSEMTRTYEVTPERARASVDRIVGHFVSLRLIGRG